MEIFILMLIVVGVVVTVAAVKSGGSATNTIWVAAAQRLGLQLELSDVTSSPKITGTRRGFSVNIDTFDKLVFDDLKNNATLVAMLAYMASEEPERIPRDRRVLPVNPRTGEQREWPTCRLPRRSWEEYRNR